MSHPGVHLPGSVREVAQLLRLRVWVRVYWGPLIVPLNVKAETVIWCLEGLILKQSWIFGEGRKMS